MLRHNPKGFSRKLVEYVKTRLHPPFLKRKGHTGEPRIFIEKMIADKEFYTSGKIAFPSSAIIETTTRCNLRCVMCARMGDTHSGQNMPYEVFERCMESLIPHLSRVDLNGHGETFLNKDFMRIFEQAKRNGAYVAITTNGTLIDESMADSLVRVGMDEMVISLDAASPELFEKIRQGARFDKILENIDNINRFKKKYGRDTPRLDIQMVAMKMNIHELPALVRLAGSRIRARSVSVIPLKEYPAVDGESITRFPELAREIIPEARRLAKEAGIELSISPVLEPLLAGEDVAADSEEPAPSPAPSDRETYMNCDDPWKFAFVSCAGRIQPCCGTDRVMGDLTEVSFPQIWHGEEYVKFRTELLSGHPPPECRKCIHRTKFYR